MVSPNECRVAKGLFGEWDYVCPTQPTTESGEKKPEPFPPASGKEWWGNLILLEALRDGAKSNAADILRITEDAVSPEQAQQLSTTFNDAIQRKDSFQLVPPCDDWSSDFCEIYSSFFASVRTAETSTYLSKGFYWRPSFRSAPHIWSEDLSVFMFLAGKNPFPALKALFESIPTIEYVSQRMFSIAGRAMLPGSLGESRDPEIWRVALETILSSMSLAQRQSLARILNRRILDDCARNRFGREGGDIATLELMAKLAGEEAPEMFKKGLLSESTPGCRFYVTEEYSRLHLEEAYQRATGTPLIPFEEKAHQTMEKSWSTVRNGVVDAGTRSAGRARSWLSSFKAYYGIK